jgi:hypothetical protein
MALSAEDQLRTEGNKLLHETMKQLVTISSGSILIVVAFVEKAAQWKVLVAVAFVGFLICIIACLVMMRSISLNVGAGYTNPRHKFEGRVYTTTVCSFLLGIVALVVFVIRNLQLG